MDARADDGQYEQALKGYRELASEAYADVDLRYLRYRSALMLDKLGRHDEAIAAYKEIWENPYSVYDTYPGRALNQTAAIVADEFGDKAEAREIYWSVVKVYPNGISADDALFELERLYEDEPRAFIERIQQIYPKIRDTGIADNLVWQTAIRLQEELGECESAIELYTVLRENFQRSGFVDNALWQTAECYRSQGHIAEEYELLENFIGAREHSILIGDYNYKFYHPAYMRLAEIEENRGNLRKAIDWYRRFQKTFVFALDWDDTQYVIVQHLVELGEEKKAQAALKELKKEWPQSNHIEKIKNLLAYGGTAE